MKNDENVVGVSMGFTLNLGNYNSMRVDVRRSRQISEEENPKEVYKEIWKEVWDELQKKVNESEKIKIRLEE